MELAKITQIELVFLIAYQKTTILLPKTKTVFKHVGLRKIV